MATKPTKITKAIKIKRSAVPVTLRILLGQLVTIGLILVSFFIFLPIPGIGWIIFLITSVLSLILNLLLSLGFYYSWKNRKYEIRPEGIIETRGIIARRQDIYPLKNVESITLKQDMLGRYGNYGTIQLYDPALKQTIYLVNIENPKKYEELLTRIYILRDKDSAARFVIK